MPRWNVVLSWIVLSGVMSSCPFGAKAIADSQLPRLFPETTSILLIVRDYPAYHQRAARSQFGQLRQQAGLRAATGASEGDLLLPGGLSELATGFVPSTEELEKIAVGELGFGLVRVPGEKASRMIVIDVAERDSEVASWIEKQTADLKQQRLIVDKIQVGGSTAYRARRGPATAPSAVVAYAHIDRWLVIADSHAALDIWNKCREERSPSLAGHRPFQYVAAGFEGVGSRVPDLLWYFASLDAVDDLRSWRAAPRKRGRDWLRFTRAIGGDAAKAIGGGITIADATWDWTCDIRVFMPAPWKRPLLLLDVANRETLKPPMWVPRWASCYATCLVNVNDYNSKIGPIVDEWVGEQGVFDDIKEGLKRDPEGPMIDVDREIFGFVGDRMQYMADSTPTAEDAAGQWISSFSTSNVDKMKAGLAHLFKDDPAIHRLDIEGNVVFEDIPQEQTAPRDQDESDTYAYSVAFDSIFVASSAAAFRRLLGPTTARPSSGGDLVGASEHLELLFPSKYCALVQIRFADWLSGPYSMVRRGRANELSLHQQWVLGMLLGTPMSESGSPESHARLPDFEDLRPHLGSFVAKATRESDGWRIVGGMFMSPSK